VAPPWGQPKVLKGAKRATICREKNFKNQLRSRPRGCKNAKLTQKKAKEFWKRQSTILTESMGKGVGGNRGGERRGGGGGGEWGEGLEQKEERGWNEKRSEGGEEGGGGGKEKEEGTRRAR